MKRPFGALVALLSLANLAFACGGSSKSGSGGSSGTDTNGTSASDGSGGSGGSTSDSSSADGSNSDGPSGTSDSGSGGTGGQGGDSGTTDSNGAGGSGGSGTGGTGGDAPMNPVPSEEAVDACAAYCERKDEVGCENEETLQECLDGCGVTTRILDCEDELLDVLDCTETADVTCDDAGEADFSGCGVAELAWLSCVVTEGPDADLLEPCEARCAAIQEADCPNDNDSEDDCILGCTVIGTILPECKGDWQDLMACGEDQEFVCNDDGQAQAPSEVCGTEQVRAWACVLLSVLE